MKKQFLLIVVLFAFATVSIAQQSTSGSHKIIFQVQTGDTLAHKALMKQLNNLITVSPDSKIELVCHGPGIEMLMTSKSTVYEKVKALTAKGIIFNACEFTMSEKNIPKDAIIAEAGFVKYGILEIVSRQEQGWSYIKAGF